ncbi:hypothetical protein NQ315_013506 [Exocentrus adspersus]|uniref:Uncharacterized protein n=1 Tax=Exocentrus adspersus TaxID=1586481 RepID=A0AAV8V6T2_9CUCU|nr:hypothetical protein NQ315_013506 [Exocentrus adspersus]
MPEYRWVDSTASSSIPSDALEGGVDVDGTKIYVGKARYNNDEMPAKVIPGKRAAFVSYAGKEIFVNKFQVK